MDEKILSERLTMLGFQGNAQLRDKVQELLRKLRMKLPVGSWGKVDICRPAVAIELACRLLRLPIQRSVLMRHCSVRESDYTQVFNTCRTALGLNLEEKNVEQILCVQYSADIVDLVTPLLKVYERKYVTNLPPEAKQYVKLESPLYRCAAFLVAANTSQPPIKVDKMALTGLAECTIGQLLRVHDSIRKVCLGKKKELAAVGELRGSTFSDTSTTAGSHVAAPEGGKENNATAGQAQQPSSSRSGDKDSSAVAKNRAAMLAALREHRAQQPAQQPLVEGGQPSTSTGKEAAADAARQYATSNEGAATESSATGTGSASGQSREAYEAWKEAMQQRKRAKLSR